MCKLHCERLWWQAGNHDCMQLLNEVFVAVHAQQTALMSCDTEVVMLQDAQLAEVQAYFSQWGPVNSCQLAHNDSGLIALISRQGPLQVASMRTLMCPAVQVVFGSMGLALLHFVAWQQYLHHSCSVVIAAWLCSPRLHSILE